MATETAGSDMGVGLAITLSAGVLVSAGFMLVGATQSVKAWGFAAAMFAAALAVVAVHAYED